MPKGQSNKPKAPKRPPAQVFASKMENAYQTYRILAVKLASLSGHRAVKEEAERAAFNRFLDRMAQSVAAFHVSEAGTEAKKETGLSEFLQ